MTGYWEQPDETEAALRGGWLRTGDLAVVDPDGYVTIVDRRKDLIVSGGENIASVEVEAALLRPPRGAGGGGGRPMPDDRWGEVPAAFVALRGRRVGHRGRADRLGPRPPRPLQGPEPGRRSSTRSRSAAPARSRSRPCATCSERPCRQGSRTFGFRMPCGVQRRLDGPHGRQLLGGAHQVEPRLLGVADAVLGGDRAVPLGHQRQSTASSTDSSAGSTPVTLTWTLPSATWPKSHTPASGGSTPGTSSTNRARRPPEA